MRIRIAEEDRVFSLYIRTRDKWKCQRCGKQYHEGESLQCSHYIGRGHQTTRFDPENCISLCFFCHTYFETYKATFYRDFMRHRLGEAKFKALEIRGRITTPTSKQDKKMIAIYFNAKLKELQKIG